MSHNTYESWCQGTCCFVVVYDILCNTLSYPCSFLFYLECRFVSVIPRRDVGAVSATSCVRGERATTATSLSVDARRDPGATAACQLSLATARRTRPTRHWIRRPSSHNSWWVVPIGSVLKILHASSSLSVRLWSCILWYFEFFLARAAVHLQFLVRALFGILVQWLWDFVVLT